MDGTAGALRGRMDAVFFEVKRAHLAGARACGRALRPFALTPARFDLMNALGADGLKQSDLWKRLNVVRSVVCEMVRALEALGWVLRVRAADARTWLVTLTRRGREVFARAYDRWVESGDVAVHMDYGLVRRHAEIDAEEVRTDFLHVCDALHEVFRTLPWFRGRDLYTWRPEDYYAWLTWPGEITDDVPFVSADMVGSEA